MVTDRTLDIRALHHKLYHEGVEHPADHVDAQFVRVNAADVGRGPADSLEAGDSPGSRRVPSVAEDLVCDEREDERRHRDHGGSEAPEGAVNGKLVNR